MFKKILVWLLKMVDVDVSLENDILTINLELGGMPVFTWSMDLIKEKSATSRSGIRLKARQTEGSSI